MPRTLTIALFVVVLGQGGRARAHCDPGMLDLWLASGPSISALVAVENDATSIGIAPLLRMGFFAGLPVQLELSLAVFPAAEHLTYAAAGARLLPFNVSAEGLRRGGLLGHNIGAIGGWTTFGWYWGAVYEWLVIPEFAVVAEVQWILDDFTMQPTPSFHLGAKFQFPVFYDVY